MSQDLDDFVDGIEPPDGIEPLDDPLGGALDAQAVDAVEPATTVEQAAAIHPVLGAVVNGDLAIVPTLRVAEVLPADFPLDALMQFVPDQQLKDELDRAVAYAQTLNVTHEGQAGIDRGDAAVTAIKTAIKNIEKNFERPCQLADGVHKSLTSKRATWIKNGLLMAKNLGRRVADETLRLAGEADAQRRKDQEAANARAREDAAKEVQVAQAAGAPPSVVEQLREQVDTAVAPPVAGPSFSAPKSNSVTKTWKARIKGTPADAEPNPAMAEITPMQRPHILAAMKAVIDGALPITVFEINWKVVNGRAKGEEAQMVMPGFEAFADTGLRSKPGRTSR